MPKKSLPLTPEQKARVSAFPKLPDIIVATVAKMKPGIDRDDALSAAGELLCRLAASFKPDPEKGGEESFPKYAYYWMKRSLLTVLNRRSRNRPLSFSDMPKMTISFDLTDARSHVLFRKPFRVRDRTKPTADHETLKRRFAEMYASGTAWRDMMSELRQTAFTLRRWRIELGLPRREVRRV